MIAPVSVVIPCYNYGRFLGEAIESVLAQTLQPAEIVVVDDGSTDNTSEVAAKYGTAVRYVRQDNRGLPAARNLGIRETVSPWLMFLDADDILLPDALRILTESVSAFLEVDVMFGDASKFSSEGIVLSGYVASKGILDDVEQEIQPNLFLLETKRFWLRVLRGSPIPHCSAIVKRTAIEQAGWYDESLCTGEDRDLWLRIARFGRYSWCSTEVARIRLHRDQLTDPRRANERFVNTHATFKKLWLERGYSFRQRKAIRKAWADLLWNWGYYWFSQGDIQISRAKFREGLSINRNSVKNLAYYAATWIPGPCIRLIRAAKARMSSDQ